MKNKEKEKIESDIQALKVQADVANVRMNNFQDDLAAALTDVAFKYFREFKDMESDEIPTRTRLKLNLCERDEYALRS